MKLKNQATVIATRIKALGFCTLLNGPVAECQGLLGIYPPTKKVREQHLVIGRVEETQSNVLSVLPTIHCQSLYAVQIAQNAETKLLNIWRHTMNSPKLMAHDFVATASASLAKNARLRDQPTGERSAERAAAILSAWTGMTWNEADVWRCQLAVKLAREIQGDFHADDYVDIAGYSALLGEQQSRHGRKLVRPEDVLTESRECKAWSHIHPSELEGMV